MDNFSIKRRAEFEAVLVSLGFEGTKCYEATDWKRVRGDKVAQVTTSWMGWRGTVTDNGKGVRLWVGGPAFAGVVVDSVDHGRRFWRGGKRFHEECVIVLCR
jgi:hypothetical protein